MSENVGEYNLVKSTPEFNADYGQKEGNIGAGNILKRKKDKRLKSLLGPLRGGEYSSSNERPVKGPRIVEDDPFEIGPILMGLDSNVIKTRGPLPVSNSFDTLLNKNVDDLLSAEKSSSDNSETASTDSSEDEDSLGDDVSQAEELLVEEGISPAEKEISRTKEVGVKLGANLEGYDDLIMKTMQGSGLQSGLP